MFRTHKTRSNEKMETVRIGIVTVSDRASRGEYEDKGGPVNSSLV